MVIIVSKPFSCPHVDFEHSDQRFDLILRGVHHVGCSYEGRVFLNNTKANDKTKRSEKSGYAGSFYIFGHGDCYGAAGHCDPPPPRLPYDTTPLPDSLPIEVHLNISKALKKAASKSTEYGVTITIVPVVRGVAPGVKSDPKDAGRIDGPISIVGYA